ncbi:MraY family glycosyltransferase [Luteibacter rhizovicinus]|uniref:MraY family glycosyltransferase n=1 Tax=Luteibacter rhizovicinus TaxID=242606 RepID=UPI001FCD603F|nr:glycosyltransferase family 4 protein [Luteibacter rhizovicinus]
MLANSLATIVGSAVLAFVVSYVSVRIAIAYAHRRGMLDAPGHRRSHSMPTPRGGGIGIVLGVLLAAPFSLLFLPVSPGPAITAAFSLAVIAVAAIGWLDDHGSLPIRPRLLIQLAATFLLCLAVATRTSSLWWAVPLLLAGVWCINLHNFMDGIDGLAAQQAMFFGVAYAALAWSAGSPALAGAGLAILGAATGFWCFNRSPAKIFMGDVGSATVGLIVFALSAMLWAFRTNLLWPALILSSAFVVDATLTLLVRMLRGARWYTPHREHLYQWLVRRGASHRKVALGYFAWNVLICVPVAWIAFRWPAAAPVCFGATYLLGAVVWRTGKQHGLRRRERHVSA